MDVLKNIGFNPLERMAQIADKKNISDDLKLRACAEIAKYAYPQRRAIDAPVTPNQVAKIEYGWRPSKQQSSGESNTTHSPVKSDSTIVDPGLKATPVQ